MRARSAGASSASAASARRIILCADDYGLAPGVNGAIRELVAAGRLNAASAMVVAPSLTDAEAAALAAAAAPRRAAIGLHLTLTGPFRPASPGYRPTPHGHFPGVGRMLVLATARRLDPAALSAEVAAQLAAFVSRFGRTPDFVDGHQHVHLFPQVRDAVLAVIKRAAPSAWLRQCGAATPLRHRLGDPKGLLIDRLSRAFRARAHRLGLAVNPAFAGTYTYRETTAFARIFPGFLDGLPDGSVVMCHPGRVDAELARLDPLTTLREAEYAYFAGPDFPRALAARGVRLA
ncbi:MAG: ChbG/HpnK family deacetylase [Xanthobacteraceae bacterium]|nr:ChbG/HpnK family deacetylase [Xanthobacteraceae bacterium]